MKKKVQVIKSSELLSLWAKAVKMRDGRCLICGSRNRLSAHHWYFTKKAKAEARYNITNGVSLCSCCHFRVHFGDVYFIEKLVSKLQDNDIWYDAAEDFKVNKTNTEELKQLLIKKTEEIVRKKIDSLNKR